jgi:AcrR family transcriptional regulator
MTDPVAARAPTRRQRVVDAALRVALRLGPRATTMESIAREAGVAKPTLYRYFPDKDAVFAAVAEGVASSILDAFEQAIERDDDAVSRIGNGLAAKYRVVSRILAGSPHADELYSEQGSGWAARFQSVERGIETTIVRELGAAGVARPHQLAQLVIASAYGIARKASAPSEIGPAIRLLAERLLRPEVG